MTELDQKKKKEVEDIMILFEKKIFEETNARSVQTCRKKKKNIWRSHNQEIYLHDSLCLVFSFLKMTQNTRFDKRSQNP